MLNELKLIRNILIRLVLALFGLVILFLFALPPIAHAAGLAKPPNNLGLVGYWSFNEGAGTQAGDASGNNNHGTLTGGPAWVDGKLGKALNFDGSDDYTDVSDSSSLDIASTITVSLWFKLNSTADEYDGLVMKSTSNSWSDGYGIYFSDDGHLGGVKSIAFFVTNWSGNAGYKTFAYDTDTSWHHVVGVYDGTNVQIYVDGVLGTSDSFSSAISTNAASLQIGRGRGGGNEFTAPAITDEVRVYNRALTATEVGALYNSGAARVNSSQTAVTTGLVGHWSFDGAHTLSTIADISGQANHGYFVGGATSTAKTIGKVGQAFSFDGTDDMVNAGSLAAVDNMSVKTISAWVYPESIGGSSFPRLITKEDTGSLDGWAWAWESPNRFCYTHYLGAFGKWCTNSSTVTLNVWSHVAVVYNCSSASNDPAMYINGVSVTVNEVNNPSSGTCDDDSSFDLLVGNRSNQNRTFDGKIDDVRIYNRTLSAAEVKQIYDEGAGTKVNAASTLTQGTSLASGLVGHWSFDGAHTLSTIADTSGQANHGYFVGGATSTAKTIGKLGQALQFDGNNDHVLLRTDFSEPSRLAVSVWFKTTSLAGQVIFGQTDSTVPPSSPSSYIPVLSVTTGGLLRGELWTGSISAITSVGSVADNNWHHAVMVGDTTNQYMYLDGALVGSRNGTLNQSWWVNSLIGTAYEATSRPAIGNATSWRYFNGTIDDVRLYSRALTADEVKQLYNLGR